MKTSTISILTVVVTFSLFACGKTESTASAPAEQTTPAASATTAPAPTPAPVTAAPAASPSGSAPVATADGEQSGVKLEVLELKRSSGGTVNLKFTMINDSDERLNFGYDFVEKDKGYGDIGGVHLIDQAGKKKYFVARDSEGKCVCSSGQSDLQKGEKRTLWAKFPAPPPEVKAVSVVVPHFTPMDDVPISE